MAVISRHAGPRSADIHHVAVVDVYRHRCRPVECAIGLGAIIVAGTIIFGGRVDEEDEDEDDDDWEDSFSAFDDDAPSASKALSRVSRPDTVKFQERRQKPESEPEPEPSQVESAYEEPEYLDEEWEGDTDDDGVTTDEDGTEWWEDEEGIWWYRTDEMEDWAEYEE